MLPARTSEGDAEMFEAALLIIADAAIHQGVGSPGTELEFAL